MMTSGNAIVAAGDKVIETGKQIAAHVLEAAVGRHRIPRRPLRDRRHRPFGRASWNWPRRSAPASNLPPELPQSLDVQHVVDGPPSAFPNGCHIAEVEVDPETGMVDVVRYTFVNDFGVVINPLLVNGQAHGGIVQGIGQALREHTVYDEEGQLLTGSYMDYAMPRAEDAPLFTHEFHPVPATTNLLGAKGCGEAGCAGALPSVMNALVDALSEYGITPHRHAGDPRARLARHTGRAKLGALHRPLWAPRRSMAAQIGNDRSPLDPAVSRRDLDRLVFAALAAVTVVSLSRPHPPTARRLAERRMYPNDHSRRSAVARVSPQQRHSGPIIGRSPQRLR